jgi:hypothetical protein
MFLLLNQWAWPVRACEKNCFTVNRRDFRINLNPKEGRM